MSRLSLKWKIILAGIIPGSFLLLCGVYFIFNEVDTIKEASKTKERVQLMAVASTVIHESQKERGKTAVFLSGGTTLNDLKKQRSINQEKIDHFLNTLKNSPFSEDYKSNLLSTLTSLETTRLQVNKESIALSEALTQYTSVIMALLDIQSKIAIETTLSSIAVKVKSLRLLEDAKESGGKLRANIASVLSTNKPLSSKKFDTLLKLKAGIDANLKSSTLSLNPEAQNRLNDFFTSDNWSTVNDTFTLVIKKSDTGNFNKDPNQFFNLISQSLLQISQLVNSEKDQLDQELNTISKQAQTRVLYLSLFFTVISLFTFLFLTYIVRSSAASIEVIKNIGQNALSDYKKINNSSDQLLEVSGELSQSSTEQASSLQQTVVSINEISHIVDKNAEAAHSSQEITDRSQQAAINGKNNIETMINSMKEISQTNDAMIQGILNSNQEISKIVHVISEIGDKTKVINDIVFQTKLLSFNASVEAARAGEHGKGFAVVAEEIGNLASMSGTAAREISNLLNSSLSKVTSIVGTANTQAEMIMKEGKEKVATGLSVAQECDHSLDDICEYVEEVNSAVAQIAAASAEQSDAIKQVSRTVTQLDQTTVENAKSAQVAAQVSQSLRDQAESLNQFMNQLMGAVNGDLAPESISEEETIYQASADEFDNVSSFPDRSDERFSQDKNRKTGTR